MKKMKKKEIQTVNKSFRRGDGLLCREREYKKNMHQEFKTFLIQSLIKTHDVAWNLGHMTSKFQMTLS